MNVDFGTKKVFFTSLVIGSALLLATGALSACQGGASGTPSDSAPSVAVAATDAGTVTTTVPTPESDPRNGTYSGLLSVDLLETLVISGCSDKGFHFEFRESGVSGDAEFSDDGYAYYNDTSGQGINFHFEGDSVVVGCGTHYGLEATYTRNEPGPGSGSAVAPNAAPSPITSGGSHA